MAQRARLHHRVGEPRVLSRCCLIARVAAAVAVCCCCVQSPDLRSLRGRDLQQLPDMKELQKMAGRGDAHVLLQATNAPIQSSSADAMKAALIQLHDRLAGPPHHCSLLLTVGCRGGRGAGGQPAVARLIVTVTRMCGSRIAPSPSVSHVHRAGRDCR